MLQAAYAHVERTGSLDVLCFGRRSVCGLTRAYGDVKPDMQSRKARAELCAIV